MDPYKILGILPHSSESEIKDAYNRLIGTYNLDDLQDDSVKSFYEDKLSAANEAYRIITHNLTCDEVRDLIESDDFIAAETKLNYISDLSSAEWNYLKGVLLIKKGWVDSGVNHIRKAATLNPYNTEYVATMNKLTDKVGSYKNNYSKNEKQGSNPLNMCGGGNDTGGGKGGLC